jgi:hypothetical protein
VLGPGAGVGWLIGTGEEHGEEVAFGWLSVCFCQVVIGSVLSDEAVDYGVKVGAGAEELFELREREVEVFFESREGDDETIEAHDGVDLVVDGEDVCCDIGVEEGAGYDFEGEGHAGSGDVDGLAGLPFVAVGCGDRGDLVGVGGDAVTVECGRDDAALAHVEGFFGGDEAFAEEEFHAADGAFFAVVVSVLDEDALDVAGIVDEDDVSAHEAVFGDVAIGLLEVGEESDGVAEFDPAAEGVEGE